jgi:3-hydroxybutyryl-CoA dehydrogenase
VIGAGMMGHAIAQVFAAARHEVAVYDAFPASLETLHERIRQNLRDLGDDESIVGRVRGCSEMAAAVSDADFIVEAAAENLEVKQKLFLDLERLARHDAVFASNTSVIPITRIMAGLEHRERALGTHWWNPAHLIPLVEVVATQWTDLKVVEWTLALHRAVGKTPVHARKDVPGFIANRLQHALWREAVALVQNGVCDAETVDTCIKASFGRRLAVLGPLENADLVGTDLTLAIHDTVLPDLDRTAEALPYLRNLVATGRLGMKTGEGFRKWTAQEQVELKAKIVRHLKAALAADRKA